MIFRTNEEPTILTLIDNNIEAATICNQTISSVYLDSVESCVFCEEIKDLMQYERSSVAHPHNLLGVYRGIKVYESRSN